MDFKHCCLCRAEQQPQMILMAQIYRNGGTDPERTHICDACIRLGLLLLRERINRALGESQQGDDGEKSA